MHKLEFLENFGFMDVEKNNLLKLLCGTSSFCVFLICACLFVSVYLPSEEESSSSQNASDVVSTEVSTTDARATDGYGKNVQYVDEPFEEIDVFYEIDFEDKKNIDAALTLYRQPQSRKAVEWFYSQVANDKDVAVAILDAAAKFNVSPALAFALAYTESSFKTNAKHTNLNGSVDRGLFQLNNVSFPSLTEADFYNPETSAYYGMSHLDFCLKCAGNEIAALAMYNAGSNKVKNNNTPQSTLNYISQIQNYKLDLEEKFAKEVLSFYSTGSGANEKILAKY